MIDYKSFYEKYAKNYPDDLIIRGSQLAKIKENIDFQGKIGLDIGCANGAFVLEIAKLGAKKMYGIDIAEEFVKKATRTAKIRSIRNVEFIQADAKKLPFKNNYFDFIICTEVLEHVPGFKTAIKEIERVLKPGGSFIVTIPNTLNPAEILHQIKHLIFFIIKREPITHINLFFMPTVNKYFHWAKKLKIDSLHFILPFLPKRFITISLVNIDLYLGKLFKPFAFDIVLKGYKK